MLASSNERVKLLRAGFTEKELEKIYIKNNNIKIVKTPLHFELIEINFSEISD